jgi:hypothetical protein
LLFKVQLSLLEICNVDTVDNIIIDVVITEFRIKAHCPGIDFFSSDIKGPELEE